MPVTDALQKTTSGETCDMKDVVGLLTLAGQA